MTRISFSVPGIPKGKARARASARIVYQDGTPRAIVSMHTPKDTAEAERSIRRAFREAFPDHVPWARAVMLRFTAVFPIPTSWPKRLQDTARRGELYHTSKPDTDNVWKLICDSLNGIAWVDDAQVQGGGVKRYGEHPRLEIRLEPIEQLDVPATPGQKRAEARVAAGEPLTPTKRRKRNPYNTRTPDPVSGMGRAVANALAGERHSTRQKVRPS